MPLNVPSRQPTFELPTDHAANSAGFVFIDKYGVAPCGVSWSHGGGLGQDGVGQLGLSDLSVHVRKHLQR